MEAYNASGADQNQVLYSLRVLKGVGGRQVTPHAVTHQHHLVKPHCFPPLVQRSDEEVLGRQAVLCSEGWTAYSAEDTSQGHKQMCLHVTMIP